ncbi:MAG: ATP-binding protein, partial [Myxococcota bacterium]
MRDRLPHLSPPPPMDPEQGRFRFFDSIATFLKTAAATRPILILLEDLHWADRPSLLLLQFIAREVAAARILIVGTYRDVDVLPGGALAEALVALRREPVFGRIALRGLAADEVRQLVGAAAGDVPAPFVEAICRETEGNPFFVLEMLRHSIEERMIEQQGGRWTSRRPVGGELPESVRQVLGQRLARLSAECRQALAVAAVIGREFDPQTLARAIGVDTSGIDGLLDEAKAAHVIDRLSRSPARYGFTHALFREALYGGLETSERRRLHLRVGTALEALYATSRTGHLAELAHHFTESGPEGDVAKAVDYATRAGEQALSSFAYEEAAEHFERALRGLELGEAPRARVCDLLLALGEAQRRSGEHDESHATLARAADLARELGDAERLARAALGSSATSFGSAWWGEGAREGRVDEAVVRLLEEARAALGERPSELRARTATRLARELFWLPASAERCAALSLEAVEIARRVGDPTEVAAALQGRHFTLQGLGPDYADERLALGRDAVRLAHHARDRELELDARVLVLFDLMDGADRAAIDQALDEYAALAADLRQPAHLWFADVVRSTRAFLD